MRAVLHNGWWLVTSVYLVVDAGLSPAQLVLIGSVQSVFALLCEVPAGVFADTISRKWSLVIFHILVGVSMVVTGLVTPFAALVATQMLWGIAWTFASGADVAWVTDELNCPERTAALLAARSLTLVRDPADQIPLDPRQYRRIAVIAFSATNDLGAGRALNAELRKRRQCLPLDPAGEHTVGGLAAAGLSGPLRFRYGTMRDLLLGVRFVQADGVVTWNVGTIPAGESVTLSFQVLLDGEFEPGFTIV